MRIFAITFGAVLLSGFAGAQPAKPGLTPCALVTKAEVQEAAGVAVSDGAADPINKSICNFKIGDTGSAVTVLLTDKGPGDSAEKMVAELKKRKMSGAVAAGIGDSAYTSSPGYGMQQLGAYKGSRHVVVTVFIMGTPESKAKTIAEKVMRKALTRL